MLAPGVGEAGGGGGGHLLSDLSKDLLRVVKPRFIAIYTLHGFFPVPYNDHGLSAHIP